MEGGRKVTSGQDRCGRYERNVSPTSRRDNRLICTGGKWFGDVCRLRDSAVIVLLIVKPAGCRDITLANEHEWLDIASSDQPSLLSVCWRGAGCL